MSIDLERYAAIYGQLGDTDIQQLLLDAAELSKIRGRPDVLFLDEHSKLQIEQVEWAENEEQKRLALQHQIVDLFLKVLPVNQRTPFATIVPLFHDQIGKHVANDVATSYLLLPTTSRRVYTTEDRLLVQKARDISPNAKVTYNKYIQNALRARLKQIGDIRNVLNYGEASMWITSLTPQTASFLQKAFIE